MDIMIKWKVNKEKDLSYNLTEVFMDICCFDKGEGIKVTIRYNDCVLCDPFTQSLTNRFTYDDYLRVIENWA